MAVTSLYTPSAGEELVIWEGNKVFDSWSVTESFDAKFFDPDVAQVGDIIRCYFTDTNSPNPVFKQKDWQDLAVTRELKEDFFQCTITENAYDYLKNNGLMLQGVGFTLTKVVLLVPKVVKYQEGKTLTFNAENGNILATEFKGYSDDAKVVFTTTITGSTGYIGWGNGKVTSIGEAIQVGVISVQGEGDNETVIYLSELKAALNEPGFYTENGNKIPTESGLTWNVWGFGDGACTSTRKSVVIYEVEGFTGEGYQPTGISSIMNNTQENSARYNLAGQKVDTSYKGVVIENGKKILVK